MGSGTAKGISLYELDPANGALTFVKTTVGIPNPAFLATDAGARWLFTVNELDDGLVSAFARDPETGKLRFLNRQSSLGVWPCHLSVDPTGRFVMTANYGNGTVTVHPIGVDGRLGPASCVIQHEGSSAHERQDGPHAHMILASPDGRFVLAADLGIDKLMVYTLSDEGVLAPHGEIACAPGSGPRQFAFSGDGRTLFVLNEIASSLTAYDYDAAAGSATPRQTISSLPAGFTGENTCAQLLLSPDGRFAYASNRGHDSIAIWAIDAGGALSLVGHESTQGKTPRNFALDPSGTWLLAANQDSDTIVTFRRDAERGTLTPTGQVTASVNPVAILFVD
jgi:6-phosphogluconolactonase